MGATDFQTYGFGRDAREAYKQAVEDALYWSGHGGYTGTIAEKSGYSLIHLPPRVSPDRFLAWVQAMQSASDMAYLQDDLKLLEASRAPRGKGKEWAARKAMTRKQIKEIEREQRKVPAAHRELVRQAAAIYDDKWGPALAWEVKGTEAKKLKEANGLKGTRKRVFCFCGYASC